MSNITSSINAEESPDILEVSIPRSVRFWLLLLFEIPALSCVLYLLFYLLTNRTRRRALNNHVIILILLIVLTFDLLDIPLFMNFLRTGYGWPANPISCLIWRFIDNGIYLMIGIFLAYASIERYILVFHHQWLSSRKKRLFGHYIPLAIVVIYCLVVYIYFIFFPPCDNTFDYRQTTCSNPCYFDNPILLLYETVVHSIVPTILITVFSIALLFRVIVQKHRLHQRDKWRKNRKMIIQMLSMSALYLILNLPISILFLVRSCGISTNINAELYAFFISYWIPLLLPFVCLISIPELWRKIKATYRLQCQRVRRQCTALVQPGIVMN